jgi:hypothetical protein
MNQFVKNLGTKNTTTWNGAISNSTSGSSTLDYFAKCGSYRGRSCAEVNADMASIFGADPVQAMKIVLYNRMVTRKAKGFENVCDTVQRGQGQRDEFVKSLAWLENNRPDYLYKNLWLVPVVGCWKDLWYDSAASGFHYYINQKEVFKVIKAGLKSEYHRGLLAKYLPKIRSRKSVKNDRHVRLNNFARALCTELGWTEAHYRKFKSNPESCAHLYQRQMCANEWTDLDFNMIPGKALFNLLSRKGKDKKNPIERHDLEKKYLDWIKQQPVAKFTGYPYELLKAAKSQRTVMQTFTYDAQFQGLIAKAKDSVPAELLQKGVLCALDTSGSMGYMGHYGAPVDLQPIDVCVGLGIYFASLIEGYFHNHVIMFDSESRFLKLQGESFCGKVDQITKYPTAWGSTNFQSAIDEIVRIRKQHPEIPVSDFPEVLLVVSDMQFNPSGSNETNYEMARRKLRAVGLPDMTIIWWQVNGRCTSDVPSTMSDPGTVLISGMDGAIVTAILGGTEKIVDEKTGETRQRTPEEMMQLALDQEILNKVNV